MVFAPDLRHPVEFGADQQDSLLLWLSERLGQAMHAPDLQQLGYTLVGGRLLPASGQPAAQLMYENPDAHRITLYIRARWATPLSGAHEGTVSFAGEGGVSMVYWIEGSLAYALIGPMDREQLFGAAKIIQQQLHAPVLPTPAQEQTATTEKDAT
jgi:anti-sigma factor RsiW